jgi:hypothetical protein
MACQVGALVAADAHVAAYALLVVSNFDKSHYSEKGF